jgi:SAM-dependent methyltransferase
MKFFSRWLPLLGFRGSRQYWENRYRLGGNAGGGSFGAPARYKAEVLNRFVRDHAITSVIEFGCGDGNQLLLADYPRYLGVDVSAVALAHCARRFADDPCKRFMLLDDYDGEQAQLALSLDVLFHLVEDSTYFAYLDRLFKSATHFVAVYSTSTDQSPRTFPHVRHRDVIGDIAMRFADFAHLREEETKLPPPVQSGQGLATCFYLYQRIASGP